MTAIASHHRAVPGPRRDWSRVVLNGTAMFWFATAIIGQWAFFYYIVAFYGVSTLSGNPEAWNRLAVLGRSPYITGDTMGNVAFAAHALGAGIIAFGGALQLMPFVRRRFPTFHRWNGRVFLITVIGLSFSGFYLVWVRDGSLAAVSTTLNGVLILTFAYFAYRTARARDFAAHRPWAMRLYLVSNAQWFLRVGFFGSFIVGQALGVDAKAMKAFGAFWEWGCFLVPLAVLQLYLVAKERGGALQRYATAGTLVALTVVMAAGMVAFAIFSQAIIDGTPLKLPKAG